MKNSYPTFNLFPKTHIDTIRGITHYLFPYEGTDEELAAMFEIVQGDAGRKLVLRHSVEEVKEYFLEVGQEPSYFSDSPVIQCPALAVIEKGNAIKKIFDMYSSSAEMLYGIQYGIDHPRRTREQAKAIALFLIPQF